MATSMFGRRPVKTALHQAVIDGRLKQVRLLVGKHQSNVDMRDIFGRTPLMLACLLDNKDYGLKMAKILLVAGANCNIKDTLGRTCLSYVCLKGRDVILKRILREDILDFNAPDNDGNTPLNLAAMSGNPKVVELILDILLKFGLPVDIRNAVGYTALLLATKFGHYVSAHMLLTKGRASPLLRDNEFFLNASDWAHRSHALHVQYIKHQSHVPSSATPYIRENTMYERLHTARPHRCHHVRSQPNPFAAQSSAMNLPSIFNSPRYGFHLQNETFIGESDAREALLEKIENVVKKRPPSAISINNGHPSTARLKALTPRTKARYSDMQIIFKLYSDQYPEMLRRKEEKEKEASLAEVSMHIPTNAFLSVKKHSDVHRKSIMVVAD